jgi:uncharacterized protein (TIGR03032 family)
MTPPGSRLWARHAGEFRDPRQVVSQWEGAGRAGSALLRARASGKWWETLSRLGITLLVTREYEHLVMALGAGRGGPRTSYLRLPHPSGIAADRRTGAVWIASTRLPNQVYELRPAAGLIPRSDRAGEAPAGNPLVPVSSRFLPGSLYLHDLALIGGGLYGTATGMNAVVRLDGSGPVRPLWWPRAVERGGKPDFTRNHLQLNSIAAGRTLRDSFYSASADAVTPRKPGDPDYQVDGRGVVFSGATRRPIASGLTRPHSARLSGGAVWVDNSGYGEVGIAGEGVFRPVAGLPGWTRGLCFCRGVAFVGTSLVLPRFTRYAPGLAGTRSVCGVHAVDASSGRLLGSLVWPGGNQVFGLDWMDSRVSEGFPFTGGPVRAADERRMQGLFYAFKTKDR